MKKAIISIVLCLPLLTGCGVLKLFEKPLPPIVPPNQVVQLDPKLLELCEARLTELPKPATHEAILASKAKDVAIHDDCVQKQAGAVIMLKKFANLKDSDEQIHTKKED